MNMHTRIDPLETVSGELRPDAADPITRKWLALHDAAAAVGAVAGIKPEAMSPEVQAFPTALRALGGWHRQQAEQGLDDLLAIMEPGLSALLTLHARGGNSHPAAMALWHEFHAARDAMLGLLPWPEQAAAR